MSKIDYQALREIAKQATQSEWVAFISPGTGTYAVHTPGDKRCEDVIKWTGFDGQKNAENNARYIAAFNPEVVQALLDERERNQQYIKRRDQENEDIALTVGKLRVELEAAENNLIDSECHVAELEEALRDKQALLEASEKRIAELEAEPVSQTCKLNEPSCNSPATPDGWISCSERMPEKNQNVLISVNFDSSLVEPLICSARYTGSTFRRGEATIKPGNGIEQATHWMPLPEPPQEVK
ncbi:ead/Ea22-like family protein [Escherichia coli]|uniref:ead/Ea22-like family protein n=1 Tax=Escherichia coli TaxID=562 RepID=UPI000BE60045|nr:ead/Ea22-like family protein [Escherichia coli]